MRLHWGSSVVVALVVPALVGVGSSEFDSSFPEDEGWERSTFCTPERWMQDGWLYQQLEIGECGPAPGGDRDSYSRSIQQFDGESTFFFEFRVITTGESSEIPGGAPTVLVTANSFGLDYTATVARDQVKLFRDADLPILFFDLDPDTPHTIRLELHNGGSDTYRWYIDGETVDEDVAEGPYPADDARIAWRGKAWYLPCQNAWDYIRYGVIPQDASGDYDSDGDVDPDDFYFFQDYFSGPGVDAGPGARWADFDSDADVDCDDWEAFELTWTGPPSVPVFPPCNFDPIPAVSDWGIVVMTLLLLTAGTLLFRRVPPLST